MGHRFFVDTPVTSQQVVLAGTESHHLQHVMRAAVGDEVTLFDGSGQEFVACVVKMRRAQVELAVVDSRTVSRELNQSLIVGVALPKGDRQRWLIEKMVELGTSRVVPIRTTRSIVHPDKRSLQRLQRTVVEASKQCGRNRLMEIGDLTEFSDFIQSGTGDTSRWVADPSGSSSFPVDSAPRNSMILVGPEGGFTDTELNHARTAHWQVVSLGNRILRIETACLVLATLASQF